MSASYPKWLYHADHAPIIVQSEEEHKGLGDGWVESPADCVQTPKEPEPIKVEVIRKRDAKVSGGKK